MRSIVIVAAALILAITTVSAQQQRQVGSYNAVCHYRCCDGQHNCSVNDIYYGSGEGVENDVPCNWESVCAQQGQVRWSRSQYPLSKEASSLTRETGCWKEWRV